MLNELGSSTPFFPEMWDQKIINRLKIFCAEMSNRLLGDTGIYVTLEGEAGDSQAHPRQVIWGLSWQWTPQLNVPLGRPETTVYVCPGWDGERERQFWQVVKEALSLLTSLAFGVEHEVLP